MKNLVRTVIFAASMVLAVAVNDASANVIVGPSPTTAGSVGGAVYNLPQPSSWGLQFTALDSSHFVSFDFTQKGSSYGTNNAGTITLTDVTSTTTVGTWSVPLVPGLMAVADTLSFSGFDDILTTGDTYQLLYTQTAGDGSNEKLLFVGSGHFPYQNSDISVTNGLENGNSSTSIWYAFNNLTTTATATVPEPSTLAMLGLGGLILVVRRRRSA